MSVTPTQPVPLYLERVRQLYDTVRSWLIEMEPDATGAQEGTVQISEQDHDPYPAPIFAITRATGERLSLTPKGCQIVGAQGRVDLEGPGGMESLVFLTEGGPVIRISELTSSGRRLSTPSGRRLVSHDVAEGWVWVQNKEVGLFPSLDPDLFHRLLEVLTR